MAVVKVTIVGGAGGVGASTAFNLVLTRLPHEIVLVDSRPEMITSHVMDLDQVLELTPGCRVRGGDMDDVADADVVVLLSATPITAGTPRVEYLARNALIADELANALGTSWEGVVVVVTNPVDALVTRVRGRTGLDRGRVVGYTINDSLRLRTGLTKALAAAPGSVEAWVLGEHGDKAVPLFDRVAVDGAPVRPTPDQARAAEEYFRTWYPIHVGLDSGRSSTWTSGLGVARMVSALHGDGELWPASIVLEGEYGIEGVAVTVPVTLGRGGVTEIHEWDLQPDELDALRASADFVRAAVTSVEPAEVVEHGDAGTRRTTPADITAAAVASFAACPDERLRQLIERLTFHLHAFATEVGLTLDEWEAGIRLLTETGRITDEHRQEFILWSDTLGLSMLVDALANPSRGATESTVLGPFYVPGAPKREYGAAISEEPAGEPAWVHGVVSGSDGTPIAGAELDVWQNGDNRLYAVQDPGAPEEHLRGRFSTREDGSYAFLAVRPVPYTIPDDGPVGAMLSATGRHPWRPAHIHLIVRAEGYAPVTTHVFDRESAYLDSDAVFAVKPSLLRDFEPHEADDPETPPGVGGRWYSVRNDIVLAPSGVAPA